MGKVLTNIKNPSTIKEIVPNKYDASKKSQIINVAHNVNKNEININLVDNLYPYNIKNNVAIWGVTGSFNTPILGNYGSVYFNYNNKESSNINNYLSNRQDNSYYIYHRPNYLGAVAKLGTNEYLFGAYGDYLYIGKQKMLKKYNQLTGENVWEIDLSSYLDNTLSIWDKMFVDDTVIFLFSTNNSAQYACLIVLNPKTGEVKYSDKTDGVVAVNYINMDVKFSGGENYDLYLYQSNNIQQCFSHKTYNITSGTIVSSKTSGSIASNSGQRSATFDGDGNCVSVNLSATKGVALEIHIFKASDASIYLHYVGTEIWDNLQYADRNSRLSFCLIDFVSNHMTLFYYYGTSEFASTSVSFTSDGIESFILQVDMSNIGRISPYQFTQNKKYTKLSSSNDQYYYACSNKFFLIFEYTNLNMQIKQTERLNYGNVGILGSEFTPIIDNSSNIVYYGNGYVACAFRDNSCYNTTYILTL